jgi:hypothetical protein
MKRKLKWTAVVLVVLLAGFGAALFLWPRDRITAESWRKIRIGMTEEEVAEILGGPAMTDEESFPPCEFEDPKLVEVESKAGVGVRTVKAWTGRRGIILIELDQENRVFWKNFQGVRWTNGGILDRLRDWLGW